MDANQNIVAVLAMVGKNLNIIQLIIRQQNAEELLIKNAKNLTVLTIIIKKKGGRYKM